MSTPAFERFSPLIGGEAPPPGPIQLRLMAIAAALLFGAGATFVGITLLLPRAGGSKPVPILIAVVCAYAVSAVVYRLRGRLGLPAFQVLVAAGTVLVSVCVAFQGRHASLYGLLYFWVALFGFYFFSVRAAVAQTAFAMGAYAILLATRDVSVVPAANVLVTAGTLVGGGALVGVLSRVLRHQAAALTARQLSEDRERRALQINDSIVQRLAVAKYALESGNTGAGAQAVDDALGRAQQIINEQLIEAGADGLPTGYLVRDRPPV
jgi:signal transduction histidine kinase